jgi:hypothetical protein
VGPAEDDRHQSAVGREIDDCGQARPGHLTELREWKRIGAALTMELISTIRNDTASLDGLVPAEGEGNDIGSRLLER